MHQTEKQRWDLQLFAEGTPAGAAENAPSGEHAAAAGQEQTAETAGPSFDEALKDPAFNRRVQEIVSRRVAAYRGRLAELDPVIETLGQKYGMDVSDISKMDLQELAKHVTEDDFYFADKATELGTSAETARKVFKAELTESRAIAEAQEQVSRRHFEELVRQAEILREKIPNFDLQRELQDPRFARMTAPGGGWTVEQAFNAVHHDALVKIAAEQATRQAAQALANSVQAGKNMPAENGSVQRSAAGTETKLYSQMSPEERRRYKEQLKNGRIHF